MVDKEEIALWKKLLGTQVKSFTTEGKTYTIFLDEKGFTCDCPDFRFNKGSHRYRYKEGNEWKEIRACKHVGQLLANQGLEVFEITLWGEKRITPR